MPFSSLEGRVAALLIHVVECELSTEGVEESKAGTACCRTVDNCLS